MLSAVCRKASRPASRRSACACTRAEIRFCCWAAVPLFVVGVLGDGRALLASVGLLLLSLDSPVTGEMSGLRARAVDAVVVRAVALSEGGVVGSESVFAGPSGSSSALNEDKSTVSRKEMAASRFTKQYAASPSTLLAARKRWIKLRLLTTLISSGGEVM